MSRLPHRLRCRMLAVLACCVFGVAAAGAQEVTLAPLLESGDEFTLEIAHERENSARPEQNGRSTTSVNVRVVAAGEKGVTLDWVVADSRLDVGQAQDPAVLAAANAMRGLALRVMLNADGVYAGLANEREVTARIQSAVDPILRAMLDKAPPERRAGFQAILAQTLSPAVLLAGVTRDAQTYFSLNGLSLAPGQTATMEFEQPSPLGGGSVPATFRVTLESATSESAELTATTTYDGAALMHGIFAGLAAQLGKPVPERIHDEPSSMQMSDEGRFVLNRTIGLMREIVLTRRATSPASERVDRWEFRLVNAPPR